MNDIRERGAAPVLVQRRIEGRAPRRQWRYAGVIAVMSLGVAAGSLVSCAPTDNRQIGITTFIDAGASHDTVARIDCIMYRESRYQNAAQHLNTNHTWDKGLFQINSIHAARWREVTGTDYWKTWMNPYYNARVALSLWRAAGLTPWRGGCLL